MKKIVSFAAAAAIAATSLVALASPYYEDVAKEDRKISNVPETDTVETTLDIRSGLGTSYANHATQAAALSSTSSPMTVNAQATLDVTNVAKEWEAYLDAAVNSGVSKENAVSKATLTGDFTVTVTSDEYVSNANLSAETPTGWTWDETTEKLFEQKSATYDAATNTFTLVMTVKGTNEEFDEYFTSLNDGTASTKVLTLTIPGTTVTAKDALTTTGEYHSVTGDFKGAVTIALNGMDISTVSFAGTDTEWFRLYRASRSSGGGSGTVRTPAPTTAPTATADPNATQDPNATTAPTATPVPNPQRPVTGNGAALNYTDHYAYIIGYPNEDGSELQEVRPQANITRAEVATIFFRMLTDESRNNFWTQDNDFSDVALEDWFNNAVSTTAAAGIITGYDDGTFRPNAPITRAEFATIAARFSSVEAPASDYFDDISTHWAKNYINKAAETGWVDGYEDGTFRPDQSITRAEAMTLINRILYRLADKNGLRDDMIKWSDNLDTNAWYYANVQEATNSHGYDREALGYVETWTSINEPRDWEALEKVDSESTDAGEEASIAEDLIIEDEDADEDAAEVDAADEDADDADADEADTEDDETDADADETDAEAEDSATEE